MDHRPDRNDLSQFPTNGERAPEPSPHEGAVPAAGSFLDFEDTLGHAGAPSTNQGGIEGPPDASDLADLSARYEIQDRLGAGGMGEVWRGLDRILKRPVAIKRILGRFAQSRQGLSRFLAEAQAIAAVNHPNIVQVYDFGRDERGYFLVMELVDGRSLAEHLRERGPLELPAAMELGAALCDALALVHSRRVVHRDIKPANILLTSAGVPKLGDFGVAQLDQEPSRQRTSTASVLGTWDYMAPEQRQDSRRADGRSDLWSLAATLYQALTGEVPRVIRPDRVPDPAREVLMKALEEDPANRYQSASEFAAALRDAGCSAGSSPPAAGPPGRCPSCARINAPDRGFCGGCGGSLREPCPACGANNGLWEQFCGQCGVNLAQRVEAERVRIEDQRRQVLSLRAAHRYREAIALLESLSAIADPRLAKHVAWVHGLLLQLRDEEGESLAARDRLVEAAQEAAALHRYHEAIRLLGQIPEPLRDERVHVLLRGASAAQEELQALAAEINRAVRSKQHAGLLAKVERYLALRPADDRARLLAESLRRWESEQQAARRAAPPPIPPAPRIAQTPAPPAASPPSPQGQDGASTPPRPIGNPLRRIDGWLRALAGRDNAHSHSFLRFLAAGAIVCLVVLAIGAVYRFSRDRGQREPLSAKLEQGASPSPAPPSPPPPPKADKQAEPEKARPLPPAPPPQPPKKNDFKVEPAERAVPPARPRRLPADLTTETNSIGMTMVLIPTGEFTMGSSDGNDDEKPPHKVRITKPFWLGKHEVTMGQFRRFVRDGKYSWEWDDPFRTDDLAAANVNWDDAKAFCDWLTKKEGKPYGLPTEAQWEYACRAGTQTKWGFGDDENELGRHAWFDGDAARWMHPVGRKQPNRWGLHDMHGNVGEWCEDWYAGYIASATEDPKGPSAGAFRVLRGGGWHSHSESCASAARQSGTPNLRRDFLGFRVARVAEK